MGLRFFAGGSVLVLVAALALAEEPPPDRLKQAAEDWWNKMSAIQTDRDKKLDALFKEMRATQAELNALLKPARAAALLGENQFKEAAAEFEKSLKDLASKPKLLGMTLIQLGNLHAVMGDYDKASACVEKGWQALQDHAATAPRDSWPMIEGAAEAAGILLQIDRPDEAARWIERGLAECARPAQGVSLQGTFLHARCLLVKAALANERGDHLTARDCSTMALAILARLYPHPAPLKYPQTVEAAIGLLNRAMALLHLEQELEAFELLCQAREILEKRVPEVLPALAVVYGTLAQMQLLRGNNAEAKDLIEKSHATYKKLFPSAKYRKSHPGLIDAMTSLGNMLARFGRIEPDLRDKAVQIHKQALDECGKFYTSPHVNKIAVLLSYGRSLHSAGRVREAHQQFQDALQMARELELKSSDPRGREIIARCLVHLGRTQVEGRRFEEARKSFEQAQQTFAALYPADHPYLSELAKHLGILAARTNDRKGACEAFARAVTLDQRQLRRYARFASEAEAIAVAQPCRTSLHAYLAVSREGADDASSYSLVWTARSTVTRVLRERLALLHAAEANSPQVRRRAQELRELSARISAPLLDRREHEPALRKSLVQLMEKEERWVRELAKEVPDLHRAVEMDQGGPAELAKCLPTQAVFVDFIRYEDVLQGPKVQMRYVAFVLAANGVPQRVELGPAEPIQQAVEGWRRAIESLDPSYPRESRQVACERADRYAAKLRRLVWNPIAKRFPTGTNRLYLAPDSHLACIPFAALPGETSDSILLESYTIGYVPHGPFLLDRLRHPPVPPRDSDRFLTLGNVAFDALRPLKGSVEVSQGPLRSSLVSLRLGGSDATPSKLCEMLAQARFAHLATHGFFKEKRLKAEHKRLQQYLRDWQFDGGQTAPGIGLGGRSPLSYTGLALAGRSVLTGSTISRLSLEGLYLVVLSTCESGLGEDTAGEGVQALPRAFHLAGCPNVIASLWKVDNAATNVLMEEFYRQLWQHKLEPLEALRMAQLELYRHPERVPGVEPGSPRRTHIDLWAAFVHSGTGR